MFTNTNGVAPSRVFLGLASRADARSDIDTCGSCSKERNRRRHTTTVIKSPNMNGGTSNCSKCSASHVCNVMPASSVEAMGRVSEVGGAVPLVVRRPIVLGVTPERTRPRK